MADLHDALRRLAADATWPPTPDMSARVRAALEDAPPARRRPRRPLLAALLALLVGGGALAAPGAGSGLLERLGLRSATVTKVKALPASSLARRLDLGERRSLGAVRRDADFRLLYPAALASPREVYVDDGVVTFLYRARSGEPILFTQVAGSARTYLRKFVTADTQRVRIGGRPGLLLRGPHAIVFDARGRGTRVQAPRLARNTLLWERDGLLLRIEAGQPADELVRIARSVRPAVPASPTARRSSTRCSRPIARAAEPRLTPTA
jgi:hypothetical protein